MNNSVVKEDLIKNLLIKQREEKLKNRKYSIIQISLSAIGVVAFYLLISGGMLLYTYTWSGSSFLLSLKTNVNYINTMPISEEEKVIKIKEISESVELKNVQNTYNEFTKSSDFYRFKMCLYGFSYSTKMSNDINKLNEKMKQVTN